MLMTMLIWNQLPESSYPSWFEEGGEVDVDMEMLEELYKCDLNIMIHRKGNRAILYIDER